MFSTESFLIFIAIGSFVALISSLIAFSVAFKALAYAREAVEYTSTQNVSNVSLAKLTQLETAVTELTDSYDALLTSHKKLRSRIGMRELRKRRNGGQDELDLATSSDKTALRNECRAKGLLK